MLKAHPLLSRQPPPILGYGVALVTVAGAVLAAYLADTLLQTSPYVSLFLCGIMFVAWFGGVGPGLFAAALSILAFQYFFLPPIFSLVVAITDVPRLVLFAIAALFVVALSSEQRRKTESLRRTRDELQVAVQELERLNNALKAENAERRKAEEIARQAERDVQTTIDTIPVMAASYRADGSLTFVNQTWRDYTGLTLDSTEPHRWGAAIHPDDLPAVEAAWRAHLETGKPFQIEQRMRRADGEYRRYVISRVPHRDDSGKVIRWYGAGYDIEDQKRAESALQRSEAYLAEAQRLSLTGSFGWKIASGDIFWSKETYQIMGMDPTVKPTIDVVMSRVHPDDREFVRQEIDRAQRGDQVYDYEHRLLLPDGIVKHVHVRSHRVKYELAEEEIIGAVVDVTAAKKAQEALHAAQASLAHVTRVTTLGEMSASIAHEVNQPLAAIVVNAEVSMRWLTREPPNMAEGLNALKRIIGDAERASRVVRRIRDLAKKADLEMTELDINDVIDEAVALVLREASSHRVALRLELGSELPLVRGDRTQLQQVIINLVINGVQAMAAVTDRPRELLLCTQRYEADKVLVAVRDVGVGIEPEHMGRLFNAFYTTKPKGLGMGLSICRSIIEAHGGRIWPTCNDGPGMTFQFTIGDHRHEG